jgi:hypothetical protein
MTAGSADHLHRRRVEHRSPGPTWRATIRSAVRRHITDIVIAPVTVSFLVLFWWGGQLLLRR